MRYSKFIRIVAATGLICSAASSQAAQLIPARFGNSAGSFSTTLSQPDGASTADQVARIPCQAFVEITGAIRDINCFTDMEENEIYVQEIQKVAQTSTISPALVDGVPTRVFMTFSVWFACKDKECNVLALPHDNIHAAEFGLNYFAPQAILPDNTWYEGFEDKVQTIRGYAEQDDETAEEAVGRSALLGRPAPQGSVAYIISADIDEEGRASKGDVRRSIAPLQEAAEAAGKGIAEILFIPGYRDGKPAPMTYQEYGVVDIIPGEDDEMESFDSSSIMWDRPTF